MELYYEQNVVNNNIDERTRRTKSLLIAKTVFMIIALFILLSSALFINVFWVFMLISLPFFAVAFVIGYVNKRNNTEYDYVIDDECIKISEIYFRERRKLKHTITLRRIESVGVFDSEGYRKIEKSAVKKILSIVNYDDEQSIVYILYSSEKGKRIMFIEPDRGFMIALRRGVSAITIFDKSMADFEKRLAEKEAELAATNADETVDEAEDLENDENASETESKTSSDTQDEAHEDTLDVQDEAQA